MKVLNHLMETVVFWKTWNYFRCLFLNDFKWNHGKHFNDNRRVAYYGASFNKHSYAQLERKFSHSLKLTSNKNSLIEVVQ